MKLLHFHTPSTPASMPPARERNRVFGAPDSAVNAASTRLNFPVSEECVIIRSGGSGNNRMFAGMVFVAIVPRPFFANGVILKRGFCDASVVGVFAIEGGGSGGREVIIGFGGWAS